MLFCIIYCNALYAFKNPLPKYALSFPLTGSIATLYKSCSSLAGDILPYLSISNAATADTFGVAMDVPVDQYHPPFSLVLKLNSVSNKRCAKYSSNLPAFRYSTYNSESPPDVVMIILNNSLPVHLLLLLM